MRPLSMQGRISLLVWGWGYQLLTGGIFLKIVNRNYVHVALFACLRPDAVHVLLPYEGLGPIGCVMREIFWIK